jgi:hypothetical protein
MEQIYGYKMTNEHSIVELAHEIQSIAKEVKHNTCVLPHICVVGGIIANIPHTWRNFAISLKDKRDMSFSLQISLDPLPIIVKEPLLCGARGEERGIWENLLFMHLSNYD